MRAYAELEALVIAQVLHQGLLQSSGRQGFGSGCCSDGALEPGGSPKASCRDTSQMASRCTRSGLRRTLSKAISTWRRTRRSRASARQADGSTCEALCFRGLSCGAYSCSVCQCPCHHVHMVAQASRTFARSRLTDANGHSRV